MPTFTAIALDRLLEPGTSKSVDKSVPSSNPVPRPMSIPKARALPKSNLERRNSTSAVERKVSRPQITPALYATPESTPLPDSPSSYPPSPYIINHKRRGPRLLKSHSEVDVASHSKNVKDDNVNAKNAENKVVDSTRDCSVTFSVPNSVRDKNVNGFHGNGAKVGNGSLEACSEGEHMNGLLDGETGSSNPELTNGNVRNVLSLDNCLLKPVTSNSERDSELEDFFEPPESMGYASNTDCEDNNFMEGSGSLPTTTPVGEFFDAWEELSSESGPQSALRSLNDVEAELSEMRLNLLMEIERRKQTEETLNNVQNQWQRIREQLALVGFTLPAFPSTVQEGVPSPHTDPAGEICQQIYLSRFVSDSIGRGMAKAEAEMEKETQIEAKNFEIARLMDRLHYYEAMNREMSQRNQEAVEMARRDRQARKRRQRWVWASIGAAITLGTAALAWSYVPASKGSSSTDETTTEHDHAT